MNPVKLKLPGILIFSVFIGFGLWLFSSYLWGAATAIRSLGWPATTGEIISSQVCESYSRSGTGYYPCVKYRYSVDGRSFEGDSIGGDPPAPGDRERAELALLKYPVGSQVKVFFNPGSPGEACLEPGAVSLNTYVAIAAGLGIAAFGLFFMVNLINPKQGHPPHEDPRH